MRILHSSALASPYWIEGVNAVLWSIAAQQARAGHEVAVVVGSPTDDARAFAHDHGLTLTEVPPGLRAFRTSLRQALRSWRPEVAHLHSVFTPRLAIAAGLLHRARIPYVATPHGGLAPRVLARNRVKKRLYSTVVERRRLGNAAALTAVVDAEVAEIRAFVPRFRGPIEVIGNPVAVRPPGDTRSPDGPVVFLGRLVTEVKGLDRLLDVARRLPAVQFRIYGDGPDRAELARQLPTNVSLLEPVFGADKDAVLDTAGLYVQPSRWDALPMSLIEAMAAGVPCAVSSDLHLASAFRAEGLGLVLPSDLDEAAGLLGKALGDEAQLARWSTSGRAYAEARFGAPRIGTAYLGLYERVIGDAEANGERR
jgi:glycosyltransferase involved in cell wall biosynthesis